MPGLCSCIPPGTTWRPTFTLGLAALVGSGRHLKWAGWPLSTYTLRCPPCSVFVLLLAKYFACFLFQNVCNSCCEAETPGSWRKIAPESRGTLMSDSPCFPSASLTGFPAPVPQATVCLGSGDAWAKVSSGPKVEGTLGGCSWPRHIPRCSLSLR